MISSDSFYRYALDKNGRLVHVSEVNELNRHDGYRCVSCGCELTPALGHKNKHHFRHKTDACSYESYIHKVWKQFIKEEWDRRPHLYVSYMVECSCDKVSTCKLRDTKTQKCSSVRVKETIDLKKEYDTCEIEGTYRGYRADILLTNSKDPDTIPAFIEICYKHPCEEEKQNAGIRIVELKVTDDNLCLPQELNEGPVSISDAGLSSVVLYGFVHKRQIEQNIKRFYVYQDENGINHGKEDEKTVSCQCLDEHRQDSMMEIFIDENVAKRLRSSIYGFGIRVADKYDIKIRHCRRCRFFGIRIGVRPCLYPFKVNKEVLLVDINDIKDEELDKTCHAYWCKWYEEYSTWNHDNLDDIPFLVWNNNAYEVKPEKKPGKPEMNLRLDRLNRIALKRIPLGH